MASIDVNDTLFWEFDANWTDQGRLEDIFSFLVTVFLRVPFIFLIIYTVWRVFRIGTRSFVNMFVHVVMLSCDWLVMLKEEQNPLPTVCTSFYQMQGMSKVLNLLKVYKSFYNSLHGTLTSPKHLKMLKVKNSLEWFVHSVGTERIMQPSIVT